MHMYVKVMYDQWCSGQSEFEIKSRYKVFIKMAHKHIGRSEKDLEEFLTKKDWFTYIKNDNSVV